MSLLQETLKAIEPVDPGARAAARAHLEQLAMPLWALEQLMDLAVDLAGITRSLNPPVSRKALVLMAGDHGVASEGVTISPQAVTEQMVRTFLRGGACINALTRLNGARLVVVDVGVAADLSDLEGVVSRKVAPGTKNLAKGPAMSRQEAIRSLEAGIEVALELTSSADLYATGEMGIGNTTPSSAITSVLLGCGVQDVTGRGSGLGAQGVTRKVAVIEQALETNQPDRADPVDVLSKVGGFELGAIAGLILGSARLQKPILVDGFISTAGALLAAALAPLSKDYMIAAHCSGEPGHKKALAWLDKRPLLDLGLRLGEGSGAALAMNLVEAAVRILTEVETFDQSGVLEVKPP